VGDHVCYISNLAKFRNHYPHWHVARSLDAIIEDLLRAEWTPRRTAVGTADQAGVPAADGNVPARRAPDRDLRLSTLSPS
jgi:hypothetical protein